MDKMPGVKVVMLVKPDDYVTAHICEHPKAGIWIELVTRYQFALVDYLAVNRHLPPPFVQTIRAAKAPAGEMIHVTAADAVPQFEQNYAKYILWQKNKGMSAGDGADRAELGGPKAPEPSPLCGRSRCKPEKPEA